MKNRLFYILEKSIPSIYANEILDMIPEFNDCVGCEQNRYHEFDVWKHTLEVINASPLNVRVAALFHDIGKPVVKTIHPKTFENMFSGHEEVSAEMAEKIMTRMGFSNEEILFSCHLIKYHFIQYESIWRDRTVKRFITKIGVDNIEPLIALAKADIIGKGNKRGDFKLIDELVNRINKLS